MKKRLFYFLLDGFGCGETKDAFRFKDEGANTALHILQKYPDLHSSYLYDIGLFQCQDNSSYCYPQNPNKDTFSCTQEMFGSVMGEFRTFPNGFPSSIIHNLENLFDTHLIGNIARSGTRIIKELGEESYKNGFPIIYTSADSVMQFAAHVETFPLSQLYYLCEIACRIYCHELPLGRVIARPFQGDSSDTFFRTGDRKDFVYPTPPNPILTNLYNHQVHIFCNRIFKEIFHNNAMELIPGKSNDTLYSYTISRLQAGPPQDNELFLINLEDFDMLYGHRRDVQGYGSELMKFSHILQQSIPLLQDNDAILIGADHGNDPTFEKHTDHTREYTPYIWIDSHSVRHLEQPMPLSYIGQTIQTFFA
ncbi:MAG: phosphopentomutase [Caldisericia bacterium]|nr:phosphopentomutase [Caldisericia bacterium]